MSSSLLMFFGKVSNFGSFFGTDLEVYVLEGLDCSFFVCGVYFISILLFGISDTIMFLGCGILMGVSTS